MKKIYLIVAFIFLFVIGFAYQNLFLTFYQQDEWWALGYILTEPLFGFMSHFSFLGLIAGAGRPLSVPLQYFLYNVSHFQIWQFAIFSILFHFLNTLLLFCVVYKLSKSKFLSFLASLFFATSSIGSQAITWIGTNTVTLPSFFFAMLAIYLYTFFLHNEQKKFLYSSIFSAIVSFFFKESSIFLLVLLPLMYVIFGKKRTSFVSLIRMHALLIGYGSLAIFIKLFMLFTVFSGQTASNVTGNSNSVVRLLLHAISYPLESLSQMYFYPRSMFLFGETLGKLYYPRIWNTPLAQVATETIGGELVSIIFSTILLVFCYVIYQLYKPLRKLLIFALILTLLSFLPYIALEKGSSYLDSRYFYVGIAGGGILLAIFLDALRSFLVKRFKFPVYIASILLLFLFLAYSYGHINSIQKDIEGQVKIGTERKNFLKNLRNLYPKIKNNSVFYITGDTDYYIGNHKVPFQQGMGYTLMVWYYDTGLIPKELLRKTFLWGMQDQGFEKANGKGFGYYWDIRYLMTDVRNKKIDKENIIGLFYKGQNKIILDITNKARSEMEFVK